MDREGARVTNLDSGVGAWKVLEPECLELGGEGSGTAGPRQARRSLLGSVHVWLPVLLKVPLLLSLLGAVLGPHIWSQESLISCLGPADTRGPWGSCTPGPAQPPTEERGSVCFPGCWCLHGPRMVTGFLGGSLSMQFRYEEEYADDVKFWCKDSWWAPWKGIVKTSNSEREVKSGRVSIRDHPAKLTFTVTLENLTEEDAGTYLSGIKRSLSLDRLLQVEVSVSPGETSPPPRPVHLPWATQRLR
ncbi:CMRF-35-like molecule 4 [Galemys pyrenaicus]|uniref:CMRF-35-like molecule 4 n=1 Tax=Galemys pyrenaicus TaxID=202257 RepID=A0A8J6DJF1_GALPY|nr:CMRF-35-like molecule 4 [Galemys pyrenaicus]